MRKRMNKRMMNRVTKEIMHTNYLIYLPTAVHTIRVAALKRGEHLVGQGITTGGVPEDSTGNLYVCHKKNETMEFVLSDLKYVVRTFVWICMGTYVCI